VPITVGLMVAPVDMRRVPTRTAAKLLDGPGISTLIPQWLKPATLRVTKRRGPGPCGGSDLGYAIGEILFEHGFGGGFNGAASPPSA
jgi:hypothetical protein